MRVIGIQLDTEMVGTSGCGLVTSEDEDLFRRMAASPNIYERLATSIAPSIYGAVDIKKAITCLLFGGTLMLNKSCITFLFILCIFLGGIKVNVRETKHTNMIVNSEIRFYFGTIFKEI